MSVEIGEHQDLFGLMDYLQLTPYNDYVTYKNILYEPYMNGNHQPMIDFLSEVLWRTAKKDVTDEINIPQQTFREHLLEFSAVENYFYKKEHEMSSTDFLSRIRKYDPSLPLQNLDRSTLKNILVPLSSLRQTCTHPNTVKGRYLVTKKHVSSMKDLLEALLLKNSADSEECLRLVASALNGLAGINLLQNEFQHAIHYYREVLQLSSRFSANNSEMKISVDKLLTIHAMFNLAEVLKICPPQEPTLRDDTLTADCLNLEKIYMEKFINKTTSAYETFRVCETSLEKLRNKFIMENGQWYSDGLNWIFVNNYYEDLIDRISTASENANVNCQIRSETERSLLQKIYLWFEDITSLRITLIDSIKVLYNDQVLPSSKILIKESVVHMATDCHLRPNKNIKNKKICPVCISNKHLKHYEGTLFDMIQRTINFEEMSLKGSWKPTIQELTFRSILTLLKSRNPSSPYIHDGETHMKIIEALKKEFKELRRFWTFLDQQICAQDELDICKVRLQLKEVSEDPKTMKPNKIIKNLSYTLENKHETVNLLDVHELDYQNSFLQNEVKINMDKLDKLLGTQNYLETLRKQQYEGQSPDPCPICKNSLERHWTIMLCGHSYCLDCIQVLLEKTVGAQIQCSVCRNKQTFQEISYIKSGSAVTDEDCNKINGNYSTKIEAVTKLLLELLSKDSHVKVLIFSFWVSILKYLQEALIQNNIKCELVYNNTLEDKIENFKDPSKEVTALLLPINLGSKGLNLIEATHVVLVEPVLNPSDELQAIGRIHRIGQTKPTVVHKFVIKNTIEESIHQAITSNADNWDNSKVTLQNLIDLFNGTAEISSTLESSENLTQTNIQG